MVGSRNAGIVQKALVNQLAPVIRQRVSQQLVMAVRGKVAVNAAGEIVADAKVAPVTAMTEIAMTEIVTIETVMIETVMIVDADLSEKLLKVNREHVNL